MSATILCMTAEDVGALSWLTPPFPRVETAQLLASREVWGSYRFGVALWNLDFGFWIFGRISYSEC